MADIYPLVLEADSWAGNDGNWSTWPIQVGQPPQWFNVLPATSNGETWIPLIEACSNSPSVVLQDPNICAESRGVGDFEEAQSLGFQQNASSTWESIGTYNLPVQAGLFDDDQAGLYGTDDVSLHNLTGLLNLTGQSVAGIVTKDFWLGSFGIAKRAANFSTEKTIVPSLLEEMKAQNLTPSASFGLDVGASYGEYRPISDPAWNRSNASSQRTLRVVLFLAGMIPAPPMDQESLSQTSRACPLPYMPEASC